MWLKRYSGLLRLHAALLSPAGEFLPRLENSALGQRQSSLRRSSTFLSLRAAPAPRTPFIFYNYRHRYPVHGTGYASLFLNPCASVYTQLGQSCSAATRLSLHIPPEQVVVDAAQQKLVKTFRQIWVSCVLLHMSYILDFLL